MNNKITDPKKQLEQLVSCQAAWEKVLHELTGLTVKVSLTVHSADNSRADLLHLFEAGLTSSDFEKASTSRNTWITHNDFTKRVSVFMPKDFDADELYPEPEDDEGYAQAVENANAHKYDDPGTPGPTRDQTDEPGEVIDEPQF